MNASDKTAMCPKCGREMDLTHDEIDIGVGVIERLLFGTCPRCGEIAPRVCCGAWECSPHNDWCGKDAGR